MKRSRAAALVLLFLRAHGPVSAGEHGEAISGDWLQGALMQYGQARVAVAAEAGVFSTRPRGGGH